MLTYKNRLSDILLPFTQSIPFPIGYITHVSICIPLKLPVYVTSISSKRGLFTMSVSAGILLAGLLQGIHSCVFTYKKDLQIVSTNLNGMYGILVLSHLPLLVFSYTGLWLLHNRYIFTQRDISSYSSIGVNGKQYPVDLSLNILFKGSIDVSGTVVARLADLSFGVPVTRSYCVSSINNMRVKNLLILSSDSCIKIGYPVSTKNTVTIYINTRLGFPTCEAG